MGSDGLVSPLHGELDGAARDHTGVLERLLLSTDATVTLFLATCTGEGIDAVTISQHIRPAGGERQLLQLGARRRVLDRCVLLRGVASRRVYLHGASVVALHRLSPEIRRGLLEGGTPIGLLLRNHRTESFREVLWSGVVPAGEVAGHFLVGPESPLLARTYRIWIEHLPAMLITERFPAGALAGSDPRPSPAGVAGCL